jgi:thiol-disulfide isomerase/thioredoxin
MNFDKDNDRDKDKDNKNNKSKNTDKKRPKKTPALPKIFITTGALILFLGGIWIDRQRTVIPNLPPELEAATLPPSASNLSLKVPAFSYQTLEGQSFDFTTLKKKVIILNFWASWCAPCVEEFPYILNLVRKYHTDVEILAVSHDSDKKDIEKFLRPLQKTYRDLLAPNGGLTLAWDLSQNIAQVFNVALLPETFIIVQEAGSSERKIVRKIAGSSDWKNTATIEKYFEGLIQKGPSGQNEDRSKELKESPVSKLQKIETH